MWFKLHLNNYWIQVAGVYIADNLKGLVKIWGRTGFDAGNKTSGACRDVSESRKSKAELL